MNLLETWVSVQTSIHGRLTIDGLRDLSERCGHQYTHSTLSEWRRGLRCPPPCVLRAMNEDIAHRAVYAVIKALNLPYETYLLLDDDELFDRVAEMFSVPERKK